MFKKKTEKTIVLKIGGRILAKKETFFSICSVLLNFLKHNISDKINYDTYRCKFLLVFGGGISAEDLRKKYKLDPNRTEKETFYHFKAIESMDFNAQNSYNLIKNDNSWKFDPENIHLCENLQEFNKRQEGLYFYKPLNDFSKISSKNIPHTWYVTSDSITIYTAHILKLKNVILLKERGVLEIDSQCIEHVSSLKLLKLMEDHEYINNIDNHLGKGTIFPVDPFSPILIKKYKISVLLLNGNNFNYLVQSIEQSISDDLNSHDQNGTLIYP